MITNRGYNALRTARMLKMLLAVALSAVPATHALAEPYIAVQQGLACAQCHVNPMGGGARNALGNAIAQTQLAARSLPENAPAWNGSVNQWLAAGADLRTAASWQHVDGSDARSNLELKQLRAYLAVSLVPERLLFYVDEQLAPDSAVNRETWVLYRTGSAHWYAKAGRMYLPFGLRLQDQQAYTRQLAGINMDTPDNAFELGWQQGHWEAQFALSGGLAGGSSAGSGLQYGLQLTRVVSRWRIGAGVDRNDNAAARSRSTALFAGVRTGPLSWLAEADLVQAARSNASDAQFAAALLECNWRMAAGLNLKLTTEWLDPDRHRPDDLQQRHSVVLEYTPFPYVQLRAGARNTNAAQNSVADTRLAFIELHAYL